MANKNRMWKTTDHREVALGDMETSHLLNTVLFLKRKQAEYDETMRFAIERGMNIPPLTINGETPDVWGRRMLKELDRRQTKEIRNAEKILTQRS